MVSGVRSRSKITGVISCVRRGCHSSRILIQTNMWTLLLHCQLLASLWSITESQQDSPKGVMAAYCQFEALNITCGMNEVILMRRARYGRMVVEGKCVMRDYGYIGCATEVLDIVDARCSGRQQCIFDISELRGNVEPCPADLTAYLEATHDCIPVVNTPSSRCSRAGTLEAESDVGYLATTTVKASAGLGTRACPLHVHTQPGQVINFTLYHFAYSERALAMAGGGGQAGVVDATPQGRRTNPGGSASGSNRCGLLAVIQDGEDVKKFSLCQHHKHLHGGLLPASSATAGVAMPGRVTHLYRSRYNSVRLHFTSSDDTQDEATSLWHYHTLIKYEVAGCPDLKPPSGAWVERVAERAVVRCNHSQETWFLTCDGTHWLGTLTNCSQVQPHNGDNHQDDTERFPFGLVIAITIGVLLGVMVGAIMLISVFIYRRRRKRSRRPAKSHALLGEDASHENDENYARRMLQDYGQLHAHTQHGSPISIACPHRACAADYAQMVELRRAPLRVAENPYGERVAPSRSNPTTYTDLGTYAIQRLSLQQHNQQQQQQSQQQPSFATFKPSCGVYDREPAIYESHTRIKGILREALEPTDDNDNAVAEAGDQRDKQGEPPKSCKSTPNHVQDQKVTTDLQPDLVSSNHIDIQPAGASVDGHSRCAGAAAAGSGCGTGSSTANNRSVSQDSLSRLSPSGTTDRETRHQIQLRTAPDSGADAQVIYKKHKPCRVNS